MPETLSVDICVIGGGSGGLSAAAAAAAFGVSVVLVERGRMGGDCLNVGCVPSKALIAAARHVRAIAEAEAFGITAGPVTVDFARVRAHIQSTIAAIAPNDSVQRFTALGVRVIRAEARFVDRRTVVAGDISIRARRFIIATGSSPAIPAIPGLDTVDYLTNETLFDLKVLPAHLAVLGGGAVGLEMAQAFRLLGVEVTVIELDRALAKEDPELAAVVLKRLRADGVALHESVTVTAVERDGSGLRLDGEGIDGPFSLQASHLLLAAGRRANLDSLDLAAGRIKRGPDGLRLGRGLRSSNRRVYAVGDAAGGPQFTHVAGYQAGIVLPQILLRLPLRENRKILPRVTFTDPEIAHVGLDAETAQKRHRGCRILRWTYADNDRAQAERLTTGLIKVTADRKGRLLGIAIAGAGAGEMIGFWSLALAKKMTVRDIQNHVPAYPTLSEIGKRAAVSYYAPLARVRWIRSLIRFLARFG